MPCYAKQLRLAGSLFDTFPLEKSKQSEPRFRKGLKNIYTDKDYLNLKKLFFEELRGSLVASDTTRPLIAADFDIDGIEKGTTPPKGHRRAQISSDRSICR